VRVADVHNASGQTLSLVRPGPSIPVYLRRAQDDREFLVAPAPEVIALAGLTESEPRTRARGAAHESFSLVFSLPFDSAAVSDYRDPPPPSVPPPSEVPDAHGHLLRRNLGVTALGLGAVGIGAGTFFAVSARSSSSAPATESQADAVARNGRISSLNTGSAVSFVAGGALLGTGLVLLLWPSAPKNVQVSGGPSGGRVGYEGFF